ncbi:hypothetical protein ACQPW1_25280 [Nocardia sp. CA-128927]|uniref:hypothetical protein n=1 Tax=Nocardia sp. CA-128927 TaxID=3239975 RepID=UPI003D98DB1F
MGLQTVTVKGRLFCNGQPSNSQQSYVQLVNKRVGFDDRTTRTSDSDGTFILALTVDRNFTITPELVVYTGCVAPPHCNRQLMFPVPDKYINSQTPYDKGTINLETRQTNEDTVC